jgi:iron-sulfur cluster assembly protein
MAVSITKSAAKRVQLFMSERGNSVGLRIGVKKTGCSGYAYVVDYADLINADDVIFEEHGIKVVVDPKSLELIDGTEVDFIKEGMNEVFRFRNPKVKGECGCGESFSID